jgi:hypothetical protein
MGKTIINSFDLDANSAQTNKYSISGQGHDGQWISDEETVAVRARVNETPCDGDGRRDHADRLIINTNTTHDAH